MNSEEQLSVEAIINETPAGGGRMRIWLFVASGLLLALAVGFYFMVHRAHGEIDVAFETEDIRLGDLEISITATGNLEATNDVEVGSELSGRIVKMTADFNDQVTSGQPLAYLDDATYLATVAKSKSEVASAKAGVMQTTATRKASEKKLARYYKTRELTAGKLPSLENLEEAEADLERAVADVTAAQASVDSAEASLQLNEADLKKTIIYSPINGIVLSKEVEVGQTVAASLEAPVIYTIAEDLRQMELVVDVDEADVGLVKEGQSAVFTVDAYPERSFEAKIVQVRYGADENDGVVTYSTVLQVNNPDLSLRPGMTATAEITVQKIEGAFLVPNKALRFSPQTPSTLPPAEENRGLLRSLMPGPPPHSGRNEKQVEVHPESGAGESTIWVLDQKNGRPEPVHVTVKATDGVMTAISSEQLSAQSRVIVSTTTQPGKE